MATIRLDFANQNLAVLQRARLPQGGLDLPRMPLSVGTAAGERLAEAGQALVAFAEVERRTQAEIAQNRARAEALRALAEAEATANGDVDEFRRRTGEALDRIAEGIPDPADRVRFRERLAPEAASIEFRVRRTGRARLAADAVSSLEEALRETGTRAALTDDPVEAQTLRALGRERIRRAIEAGYLSPEAARERELRWEREVSMGQAQRLLRSAPAEAQRLLRDPAALPGLTIEDRFRLLDRAVREGRRAAGGSRRGGGARPADVGAPQPSEDGLPLPPPRTPRRGPPRAEAGGGLDVAALEAEGEAWAEAQDAEEYRRETGMERAALARFSAEAAALEEAWMRVAAGEMVADAPEFEGMEAVVSPLLADAARAVATFGEMRPDPERQAALMGEAGEMPEPLLRLEASRAVAEGALDAAGWVRLVSANRETRQDREWARVRAAADEMLTPPELGDVAPGLGSMAELRIEALAEMDRWRAANPRAGLGPARAAAEDVARRAREVMAERLMQALPRVPGLPGAGPWRADALNAVEDEVVEQLDAGELDEAEAARRLRALEGWRWVGEVFNAGDDDPDPDAPGNARRGGRMRVR
jgi:hypothetical protein